jgi:hypothetical protein
MYVEPVLFSVSEGKILMAGTPNYIYATPIGDAPAPFKQSAIFGAVADKDGLARTIPSPVTGLPMSQRGVARSDGSWDVVFAEEPADYKFPDREHIVALWYGVLRGNTWSNLEKIPLPPGKTLSTFRSSPLVSHGDTLSWAMTYSSPDGSGAVLFERRSSSWNFELVPIEDVVVTSLAYTQRDGLLLLPVRGGLDLGQANTMFMFKRGPSWTQVRQLIAGGTEPVFDVQLTDSKFGHVLSWWALVQDGGARRDARTRLHALETPFSPIVPVENSVSQVLALTVADGIPLWITETASADPSVPELRIATMGSGENISTSHLDDPFTGPFAATVESPSTVLLSGPHLILNGEKTTLETTLVRVGIRCSNK